MTAVSVIVPARDAAATLGEALASLLPSPEIGEIIVVDDRSRDDTANIARAAGDPRIRVVTGPAQGFAAAFNCGFAQARCMFVAECDADDLYPLDRLSRQVAWLRRNHDYVAISGGFRAITADGSDIADLACDGVARDVHEDLQSGRAITHLCAWLTRADAMRAAGALRPWFETGCDLDLQFRIAARGKVWHEPIVSYLYRVHDRSMVHTQDATLRNFYEEYARAFARQRAAGGLDDLDRGRPPALPETMTGARLTAREHSIALLVGAAWRLHQEGNKIEAMRRMVAAVRLRPLDPRLWKGLVALAAKRGRVKTPQRLSR